LPDNSPKPTAEEVSEEDVIRVKTTLITSPVLVIGRNGNPRRPANAWSVKTPGSSETVCKRFMIPRGYIVIGEKRTAACPHTSGEKNAWLIPTKSPP
jgi:hypothetical protein